MIIHSISTTVSDNYILETDVETQNSRKKRTYITDISLIPERVVSAISTVLEVSRPNHVIGIFSYLFTTISRNELSDRYIIKDKDGPKNATIYYINKHIINYTFDSIAEQCSDLNIVATMNMAEDFEYRICDGPTNSASEDE